jgi:hypothetical protein
VESQAYAAQDGPAAVERARVRQDGCVLCSSMPVGKTDSCRVQTVRDRLPWLGGDKEGACEGCFVCACVLFILCYGNAGRCI